MLHLMKIYEDRKVHGLVHVHESMDSILACHLFFQVKRGRKGGIFWSDNLRMFLPRSVLFV